MHTSSIFISNIKTFWKWSLPIFQRNQGIPKNKTPNIFKVLCFLRYLELSSLIFVTIGLLNSASTREGISWPGVYIAILMWWGTSLPHGHHHLGTSGNANLSTFFTGYFNLKIFLCRDMVLRNWGWFQTKYTKVPFIFWCSSCLPLPKCCNYRYDSFSHIKLYFNSLDPSFSICVTDILLCLIILLPDRIKELKKNT